MNAEYFITALIGLPVEADLVHNNSLTSEHLSYIKVSHLNPKLGETFTSTQLLDTSFPLFIQCNSQNLSNTTNIYQMALCQCWAVKNNLSPMILSTQPRIGHEPLQSILTIHLCSCLLCCDAFCPEKPI